MRKIVLSMCAAALIGLPSIAGAATGCTYPTSLDSFVNKIAGDFLTISDVNKLLCAIEKTEAELGTNPSGGYATVVARLNDTAILSGNAGGQTLRGGSGSGEALLLHSTSHATKGVICLGTGSCFDEFSTRLGIGTTTPAQRIHAVTDAASVRITAQNAGAAVGAGFQGQHARGTIASPTATQGSDIIASITGVGRGATAYSGEMGRLSIVARENWTDSAQGTSWTMFMTPVTTTTPFEFYTWDQNGFRVGGGLAETAVHVGLLNNRGDITLDESTATTATPSDGNQVRIYMKANKLIFAYNDGGTVRFKYLDLTGTGVTGVHDTSAP